MRRLNICMKDRLMGQMLMSVLSCRDLLLGEEDRGVHLVVEGVGVTILRLVVAVVVVVVDTEDDFHLLQEEDTEEDIEEEGGMVATGEDMVVIEEAMEGIGVEEVIRIVRGREVRIGGMAVVEVEVEIEGGGDEVRATAVIRVEVPRPLEEGVVRGVGVHRQGGAGIGVQAIVLRLALLRHCLIV